MLKIVYNLDGRTCIVHPCISRDDPEGFTYEAALARALAKDIPDGATNVRVVNSSELPARAKN